MPSLFDKAWSPYVAGIVIGLLQIPAFLMIETALGASSSYVTVGAAIASWFDPSLLKIDYVAARRRECQEPVAGGAGRRHRGRRIHLDENVRRKAPADFADLDAGARLVFAGLRYAVAFVAGFMMLFGARIADGCTSGHGLSGMAQLVGRLDRRGRRHVRRRHRHRHAAASSHLIGGDHHVTHRLAILIGLLMGVVFGFALEKSRVFEPGIIVGQMQLRNFIMLKVFLTAVATGAVVLAVSTALASSSCSPRPRSTPPISWAG